MHLLPIWKIPVTAPAFFDMDSATAIEQTARLYDTMAKLISEYNEFAVAVNKEIVEFTSTSTTEIQNFKDYIEKRIRCKFDEIDEILSKMKVDIVRHSDNKIAEMFAEFFDETLKDTAQEILNEMIRSGDLSVSMKYDAETEALTMIVGGEM